ncbi:copper homeostasis protein CutC [Candidatus Cloacimonadota bacterium]
MILEICTDNLNDAIIAADNGADRIELNSALKLGGLTPSIGLVKAVKSKVEIPVIAMLRPRAGGFRYSPAEFSTMLMDAMELIDAGVDGIAFGILNEYNEIDTVRCQEIVVMDSNIEWVFHRAFDDIEDHRENLGCLIKLGFNRVLTSGGCKIALEGLKLLRELNYAAAGRIAILAGSGINKDNVQYIVENSGCKEIHASLSRQTVMGRGSLFSTILNRISSDEVKKVRSILDSLKHY